VTTALISDVHANLEALEAVLERIDRLGVRDIRCLGDIVGYHADPEACVRRLVDARVSSLAGNHDRAVVGSESTLDFGARARRAVRWTRQRLSDTSLAFLRALPVSELVPGRYFAVHAALHPEPNDRLHLSTRERVRASLVELATGRFGSLLCLFGHTHRPVIHRLEGQRVVSRDLDRPERIRIELGVPTLINPGSVGQSRDGDPRAAFAVLDGDSVELFRVEYDVRACHDKARRAGLFDPEPAHLRSSAWIAARAQEGARLVRRAIEKTRG